MDEPARDVANVDMRSSGPIDGVEPKRLSERGQELASTWCRRIADAKRAYQDTEDERRMYREAEEGYFPTVVAGAENDPVAILMGLSRPGQTQQVVLNVVSRVIRRSKGKAFDARPIPRFPRRKSDTNDLCEGVERLLERVVVDRGGIVDEFRDGVSDVSSEGGFGVFIGMPWIPMRDEVDSGSKGGDAAVEDALAGEVDTSRTVDHRAAAGALLNVVGDEDEQASGEPEQIDPMTGAVGMAAQAHADAADAQESSITRFERASLDVERLRIGEQLLHDPCSGRKKHWRWMARFVTMARREAWSLPSLRSEWVNRLPSWREDEDGGRSEYQSGEADPDAIVAFWEVWDRWHLSVHLVCDGVEGYGEVKEENPYRKRDGSGPSIRGFFPFVLCVPNKTATGKPIPGARSYWQQQIELIIIDSAIVSMVKRAAQDIYGVSSEQFKQLEAALRSGVGGAVVPFPPGTNVDQAFRALQMAGPLDVVLKEREQKLVDISIAANFPLSELTSQPQAETLGQERIASAAGQTGVGDEVAQYASAMGECFDIAWDLIREHFAVEDVNAEMGADLSDVWDSWAGSSLGDERVTVELGRSASDDNPQRAEQIMAFATAAAAVPSAEFPGFPAFDVPKLWNMASKAVGLGELPPFKPTPEMLQAMQQPAGGHSGGQGAPPKRPASRRGGGGSRGSPGAPEGQETGGPHA